MSVRASAARPGGEREASQLREVGDRVGPDDEQEEREARRVDGAEEMRVRACDNEPDTAPEQCDRRTGDKRCDRPQERPGRALRRYSDACA